MSLFIRFDAKPLLPTILLPKYFAAKIFCCQIHKNECLHGNLHPLVDQFNIFGLNNNVFSYKVAMLVSEDKKIQANRELLQVMCEIY
jgi:hypothetical protein